MANPKRKNPGIMRIFLLAAGDFIILPLETILLTIDDVVLAGLIRDAVDSPDSEIGFLFIREAKPSSLTGKIGTLCFIDAGHMSYAEREDRSVILVPVVGVQRFRVIKIIRYANSGSVNYPAQAEIQLITEERIKLSSLGPDLLRKYEDIAEKISSLNIPQDQLLLPDFKKFKEATVGQLSDVLVSRLPGLPLDAKLWFLENLFPLERFHKLIELLEKTYSSLKNRPNNKSPAIISDLDSGKAPVNVPVKKNRKNKEASNLREKFNKIKGKLSEDGRNKIEEEFRKLETTHKEDSSSYSVSLNYLDFVLSIFDLGSTEERKNIPQIRKALDEDHYGLSKIKKRIIEYVAVKILNPKQKSPILCFVGPPGVGKTSLGKSIACALNRKFCRWSVGGVSDEAEIRGHRATYVGALPGRILQAIKNCGSSNPLFMIDEIDKLGRRNGINGDPESALLEVLDSEQNFSFSDNYVQIGFDLSKVLFIVTANTSETIPPALKDRFEILYLPGYSEEEKINIAKQFLIPRQLKEKGLLEKMEVIFEEKAISRLIGEYTRESGVRNLEREIATILRQVVVNLVENPSFFASDKSFPITFGSISEFSGPRKYFEDEVKNSKPGVAIGLAWTEYGGEILFIESIILPGHTGQMTLTGHLGKVMEESAQIALSYLRSRIHTDKEKKSRNNIHLHVPSGAVPKDGPSAGLAIALALYSLFKSKPDNPYLVKKSLAATGEITLRGEVLPVGGIKEKIIGGVRAGIEEIILPKRNEGDLLDLPLTVLDKVKIHLVEEIDEALDIAFPERKTVQTEVQSLN